MAGGAAARSESAAARTRGVAESAEAETAVDEAVIAAVERQ